MRGAQPQTLVRGVGKFDYMACLLAPPQLRASLKPTHTHEVRATLRLHLLQPSLPLHAHPLQLKGAYGGLNKALRASTNTAGALEASALLACSGAGGAGGHVSLAGPGGAKGEGRGAAGDSVDTLLATLAPHENVIEFYVTDANLAVSGWEWLVAHRCTSTCAA
jgi:hypothetical protein